MIRFLLLSIAFCVGSTMCYAQPNVEIFWKDANRADTVIDFGVTLEGSPTTRAFTIINHALATVAILESNPQADPYYQIVNVKGVAPADPRKEEFERVGRLPYYIPPGETRSFVVSFRALASNPLFPPEVLAEALLKLRVVDSAAPLTASANKTFRLRALKTTKILGTTTPWIAYDSVYVNPQPSAPSALFYVDNAVSQRIPVDRQIFQMQTAVVGLPEIEVDMFPSVEFGPQDSVVWTTRYKPYNRGLDSAHFLIVYRPDVTAQPDTVIGKISGVGVEQQLSLTSATGNTFPVTTNGDTIDFGPTLTDGLGVSARIIVRNDGNLNIGVVSEEEIGTMRDTTSFIVLRSLAFDGPTIRTSAFDTLDVTFIPRDAGDYRIRYVVSTDLLQRGISGVPDGAQTKQWYFKGFGQRPQIQVTPSELAFGTVVLLSSCTSTVERTFSVRNVGNAELRVDSIRVTPATARMTVSPASFRLAPSESQVVRCIFEPDTIGQERGEIILWTNSLVRSYAIPYSADVVTPDTVVVSFPVETMARPGSEVTLAVSATARAIATVDRCILAVNFNPSLLRYRGVLQSATASEGSLLVSATEQPRGSLVLELRAPSNFLERPTLINIIFDSFLGEQASTDISFINDATSFGNEGCRSVLSVVSESGTFQLDSLCGLDYKTVVPPKRTLAAGVFPNPAHDVATISLILPLRRNATITLVDVYGRELYDVTETSYPSGISMVAIPVSHLPTGAYTLLIRSGRVYNALPLMIGR